MREMKGDINYEELSGHKVGAKSQVEQLDPIIVTTLYLMLILYQSQMTLFQHPDSHIIQALLFLFYNQ